MINLDGKFPIPTNETFGQVDSTKLQEFMDCPREMFYEHFLGWKLEQENQHLWFGSCVHVALEHLSLNGYTDSVIAEAYSLFLEEYRQKFPPETDLLHKAKTPANVMRALVDYAHEWHTDNFETLYTEVAGSVPISNTRKMLFRIDAICKKSSGKHFVREYKTGSRLSTAWTNQWTLSVQIGTYLHTINCLYTPEAVEGAMVDGLFFEQKENKFSRQWIIKTPDALSSWLYMANSWYEQLEVEVENLKLASDSDRVMQAFPMNSRSCTKYGTCPYYAFCCSWANPLQHCANVPIGMQVSFWNPENARAPKKVVEL